MFGLGMSELVVLGVLALILIGPKQLPEVARTLGRFLNDLKRSAEGITEDIKKQAKVDLDLELGKDFFEEKPKPQLKIMQDHHASEHHEEKPDVVIQAPDQLTFTFNPEGSEDVARNENDPAVNTDHQSTNKDGEKKD